MDKMYTLKEVSEILKLSTKTISRYIEDQKLEALWFGNRWRIKKEDLERFINDRETKK